MNEPQESDTAPRPPGGAAGLAAMSRAAIHLGAPLAPYFQAYTASMYVGGLVAPPSWFTEVSRRTWEMELRQAIAKRAGRKATDEDREVRYVQANAAYEVAYGSVAKLEDEFVTADRELTLVDATILPAVGTAGTQSGGAQYPVVRVPLSSINVWWLASGEEIKARGGWNGSFGFLFPVD